MLNLLLVLSLFVQNVFPSGSFSNISLKGRVFQRQGATIKNALHLVATGLTSEDRETKERS